MKIASILAILLFGASLVQAQRSINIEVNAGPWTRVFTPIQVILPKALPENTAWQLVNRQTGKTTPAQLLTATTLVFILPDSMPAGSVQTYHLQKVKKKATANTVTIEEKEYGLLVSSQQKPLLFYHTREALPPIDSQAYYRRSGFIHPLYSPNGKILTDDFPAGHTHQHALFTAWTNTTFRKSFVDFWNQQHRKGTVEHIEVLKVTEGPVVSQIQVKLRHKSLQHGEILQEIWTLNFYPFTNHFLFDLLSEQRNVTTDTLFLNKYHYGGLGFRGSRSWNPEDKENFRNKWQVLTSEGAQDSAANHTHVRWVDASGIVNGEMAGTTVFTHPANFRYPQAIRVHATMPYFVYSPVVDGAFTINPGSVYRSQFRYYVHQGTIDPSIAERLDKDWTTPPTTKVSGQ